MTKVDRFGIPLRRKYPPKIGANFDEIDPIFGGYFPLNGIPNRSAFVPGPVIGYPVVRPDFYDRRPQVEKKDGAEEDAERRQN